MTKMQQEALEEDRLLTALTTIKTYATELRDSEQIDSQELWPILGMLADLEARIMLEHTDVAPF